MTTPMITICLSSSVCCSSGSRQCAPCEPTRRTVCSIQYSVLSRWDCLLGWRSRSPSPRTLPSAHRSKP
uniref:Putative secreted protein n=1 Tax=Anopheles triannulatus TaxID=58253 RepID=A0A2M4B435_9DIPT